MKYHIKRRWMESIKNIDGYLVTFLIIYKAATFLAIEQANSGCVVIWKTFDINMPNIEIFQRVFWLFKPSIEGLNIVVLY